MECEQVDKKVMELYDHSWTVTNFAPVFCQIDAFIGDIRKCASF